MHLNQGIQYILAKENLMKEIQVDGYQELAKLAQY